MTVFVLGATGMLGHRLAWGLDALGHDVMVGVRSLEGLEPYRRWDVFEKPERVVSGLDAFDLKPLLSRLKAIRPETLINCIGIIKQDKDGKSSVPCIALNALLPQALEDAVQEWGGRLIHFSTDCVFSGRRGSYTEADLGDATDWYGRTKLMGEVKGPNAITLRTSFIGPELRGRLSLLEWFLSNKGGTVNGYEKAIYSGITTCEAVRIVDLLLREHPDLSGLYHVSADPISKFELLCLIRDAVGVDIEIHRDAESVIIDLSLDSGRFRIATGWHAPSWPDMIAGLADDITRYRSPIRSPA